MSYSSLIPLLKKTGSPLTVEAFQARINIVFHDHEALHYDAMHQDMWDSLQEQINLLVDDWYEYQEPQQHLSLLDIGCGTGLSTQKLLHSKVGQNIDEITLLDTSSVMLQQAEAKAKMWNKKYTIVNSDIATLKNQYDVIMVCSVLHHIPELADFLKQIDGLLKPGGIFIHLQDPNGDYLNDVVYQQRLQQYEQLVSTSSPKKITDFFPKSAKHWINRNLGRKNYIDRINDQLLAEKVIRSRMTADEIWSVTDIHVENKFNTINKGISAVFLKEQLRNFQLIKQRSYAFYSVLKSDLPAELKSNEDSFCASNEYNGRNVSCIWIKK
ncbi:class I SAM-dependent methyltransferase [Flavobacterium sp.]|uniref:class I SAM-dependent methyltransferase n=1 Tax=Flavobacterium sp. TaxID=239 RepID=UPI00286A6BCC|nr:class I SAM-dependent methyltransferase [Flavobacterium sp.]